MQEQSPHFLPILFGYNLPMKKITLLTLILISTLFSLLNAQDIKEYVMVSAAEIRDKIFYYESNRSKTMFRDINVSFALLKSTDNSLNITNIRDKDRLFAPLAKEETFQDANTTYWLKVDLGSNFPSGRFVCSYGDPEILAHTFKPSQAVEMFRLRGATHLKFTYTDGVDPRVYYFKLKPRHFRMPLRLANLMTQDTFYATIATQEYTILILGLLLGLIVMAGLYNAAMYYYNRDKAFLYYALLQLFMAITLYDLSGANVWNEGSFFCRNISYESVISLLASFFATSFTLAFLEVRKHLPRLYILFRLVLALIGVDILISLFYRSLLIEYFLLPFLMLPFLYAGYKRIRQGYKPARFYLAGWTVLTVAVFLNIFQVYYDFLPINPLYLGAATEAILFSLALSYKIRLVHQEKEEQKELLVHQSKLASMGEMIGNIAHQWRQPLTHLSYTFMNIQGAHKHDELTPEYLDTKIDEANTQLAFMSETIDDFKDFYAPKKEKEDFSLAEASEETLGMMKNSFKSNGIEVKLHLKESSTLHTHKNEYKQVLLNLLSNAKDALRHNATPNPQITLTIDANSVTVEDNAGGIPDEILPRIYEPYFSTKEGSSGIGLYMSKMIVEKNIGGKLTAENTRRGTKFRIVF